MKESGFTLLEIIVVIVLIGILSSIAVIKYFDMKSAAASEIDTANAKLIESSILIYFSKEISQDQTYQLSDAVDDYNAGPSSFFQDGEVPVKSNGNLFTVSYQNDKIIVN